MLHVVREYNSQPSRMQPATFPRWPVSSYPTQPSQTRVTASMSLYRPRIPTPSEFPTRSAIPPLSRSIDTPSLAAPPAPSLRQSPAFVGLPSTQSHHTGLLFPAAAPALQTHPPAKPTRDADTPSANRSSSPSWSPHPPFQSPGRSCQWLPPPTAIRSPHPATSSLRD